MKRTRKKVLGVFGLVAVAAITAFAAFLPTPNTQATNSSVTDTIVVRVVASTTNVYITGPESGSVFVSPDQTVTYNYENTAYVTIVVEYIDDGGNTYQYTVDTVATPDRIGSSSTAINLDSFGHGYGTYIIKVIGDSGDGVPHEKSTQIFYLPVTATADADQNTGDANVTLNYNENSNDIDKIILNVYDKDGNLIDELSPISVMPPGKDAVIPFSKTDLPSGIYTIEVIALDRNGDPLHKPFVLDFDYKKTQVVPVPDAGGDSNTPNTGGLLAGLNISQTDYLITGLLVFLIAGTLGIYLVAKNRKTQNKRR